MIDLDKLDAAYAATTQGAWRVTTYSGGLSFNGPAHVYSGTTSDDDNEPGMPDIISFTGPNATFAAAIHNAYPALAAELRELRATKQNISGG